MDANHVFSMVEATPAVTLLVIAGMPSRHLLLRRGALALDMHAVNDPVERSLQSAVLVLQFNGLVC